MKKKLEIRHVCDCKMCGQPILVVTKGKGEPEIAFTCRCYEKNYPVYPYTYPIYRYGPYWGRVWCGSSSGTGVTVQSDGLWSIGSSSGSDGVTSQNNGELGQLSYQVSSGDAIDLQALIDSGDATLIKEF